MGSVKSKSELLLLISLITLSDSWLMVLRICFPKRLWLSLSAIFFLFSSLASSSMLLWIVSIFSIELLYYVCIFLFSYIFFFSRIFRSIFILLMSQRAFLLFSALSSILTLDLLANSSLVFETLFLSLRSFSFRSTCRSQSSKALLRSSVSFTYFQISKGAYCSFLGLPLKIGLDLFETVAIGLSLFCLDAIVIIDCLLEGNISAGVGGMIYLFYQDCYFFIDREVCGWLCDSGCNYLTLIICEQLQAEEAGLSSYSTGFFSYQTTIYCFGAYSASVSSTFVCGCYYIFYSFFIRCFIQLKKGILKETEQLHTTPIDNRSVVYFDLYQTNKNANSHPTAMLITTKYQIGFCVIGLINNLIYVLILTSAQDVAAYFHRQNFMSLLGLHDYPHVPFQQCSALIVPSAGILIVNSLYLLKISHRKRVFSMLIISAISTLLYAIFCGFPRQDTYAFYVCVGVALVTGANQAVGECVMIAFIKKFPSQCISGWSSGTGFAGLFGSGLYLVLRFFNVNNSIVFFAITPLIGVYGLVFTWLERNRPLQRSQNDQNINNEVRQEPAQLISNRNPTNTNGQQQLNASIQPEDQNRVALPDDSPVAISEHLQHHNVELSLETISPIFKKLWWVCLNLAGVFYLEYTILTSFADVMNRKGSLPPNPNLLEKHAYEILSFMYQIGVCISRSSLYCFKAQKWQMLTVIQLLNFSGWFVFCFFHLNIYAQFGWMIFVGLIGGCSYVNIYYCLLQGKKFILDVAEKELAINLLVLATDISTTLATGTSLVFANTIFINK